MQWYNAARKEYLPRPDKPRRPAPKGIHYNGRDDFTRYLSYLDGGAPDFPRMARLPLPVLFCWVFTQTPVFFYEWQVMISPCHSSTSSMTINIASITKCFRRIIC